MKATLTLTDFPMEYFEMFKKDIRQYVKPSIQVGGPDTVFVTFEADVIHAQEAIIICDKYAFKNPR